MRRSEPPPNALAVGFDAGELHGVNVESVDDLLGALVRLADGGVDVVLLSLDLPDGSGADAVRSIRERAPDVPVIAIVADVGGAVPAVEAERAIDEGASDVVAAGAGPELLGRAIRYATSIRQMETELQRRQVVDELTGLYNARGLEHLASHHLAMADRSKRPVTLVFVRLDAIADLEVSSSEAVDPVEASRSEVSTARREVSSSEAVDPVEASRSEVSTARKGISAEERHTVVSETADVLRDAVRSSDVLARVGPGSFCVLLAGEAAGAESLVLSRLVEAIAESNARTGRTGQLSISVGAAVYDPARPVPLDELIAQADRRIRETGGS